MRDSNDSSTAISDERGKEETLLNARTSNVLDLLSAICAKNSTSIDAPFESCEESGLEIDTTDNSKCLRTNVITIRIRW